jgi:hypothetical protein
MRFKDWLIKEVGTTTGDIAAFRRIALPMVRRMWPPSIATMFEEDPPKKPKKPYRVPQVQEVDMSKFDPQQVKMGRKVEKEHDGLMGKDTDVVKKKGDIDKIVAAHLREKPDYYTRLNKVENKSNTPWSS